LKTGNDGKSKLKTMLKRAGVGENRYKVRAEDGP